MKFCVYCGCHMKDNDIICEVCGQKQQIIDEYKANEQQTIPETTLSMEYKENSLNSVNLTNQIQASPPVSQNNKNSYHQSTSENHPYGQRQAFGKRFGMQQLLSQAPLSSSFTVSSAIGGLLMFPGIAFLYLALSQKDYKIFFEAFLVLIPFFLFVIGQYVFILNGRSYSPDMSTTGMSIIKASLVMQLIYQILYGIAALIWFIRTISKINRRLREWYYFSNQVKYIRNQRIKMAAIFILILIFLVLNFIALTKTIGIMEILTTMQRTEVVPERNLSIFPVIIYRLDAVVMFFVAYKFLDASDEYYTEYFEDLSETFGMVALFFAAAAVFLLLLSSSITSFNKKMDKNRYTINEGKEEKNNQNIYGKVLSNQENITKNMSYSEIKEINDNKLLANNGWRCKCGVVNPSYTGTCGCGRTKAEVERGESEEQEVNITKQQTSISGQQTNISRQTNISGQHTYISGQSIKTPEQQNNVGQQVKTESEDQQVLQTKMKTYDLKLDNIMKMKELLDSGAITQEEFDEKKKQLLQDI